MNYIDFILAGVLILGFILGYKDGLIRKVIGVIGIIAGLFLAVKFSRPVGKFLAPLFDNETYFSDLASGIIIFLVCIIAASIIKRVVHPHDKVNQLANQVLGGLTGTLQVAFFISCFLLIFGVFNFPNKRTAKDSLLYGSLYNMVPKTVDLVVGDNTIVKDYIESKDQNTKRLTEFEAKRQKKDSEEKAAKPAASKSKTAVSSGTSSKSKSTANAKTSPARKVKNKKTVTKKETVSKKEAVRKTNS